MRIKGWLAGVLVLTAVAACSSGAPAPSVAGATSGGTPPGSASASTPSSPGPSGPGVSPSGPAATNDPSATLPDPCTLITVAEAGIAVTKPVSDGVPELVGTPSLGDGRTCAFKVAAGGDGQATTETYRSPGDLWDAYKLQQGQFGPVKNLAGVGDKAFTVGNGECDVVKGAVLLIVRMFPADKFKTDPEPRTLALCKQAVARL
jgi:hypothetical protein